MNFILNIVQGWYSYIFTKFTPTEKERLFTCKACAFGKYYVCKKCGCFIPAKVKVISYKCKYWKK
jgi:hypothetical protein